MKKKTILGLPFFMTTAIITALLNAIRKGLTISNVLISLFAGVTVALIANSIYNYYLKKDDKKIN